MEGPELNLTSWGVDQFLSKDKEKKKRRHSRASTLNELGSGRPISPSGIPTHPTRAASPDAASVLVDRAPNRRVNVLKAKSIGKGVCSKEIPTYVNYFYSWSSFILPGNLQLLSACYSERLLDFLWGHSHTSD